MGARARLLAAAASAAAAACVLMPAAEATAAIARSDVPAVTSWVRHHVPKRIAAWRWALRQQGKPYEWGGTGPWGFDCSGLAYAAYLHAGIRLPRTTFEMLGEGVSEGLLIQVPVWAAKRGDLAFYGPGHVELVEFTRRWHWTFGALEPGTLIGFHKYWPGSGWSVWRVYRVRGAG